MNQDKAVELVVEHYRDTADRTNELWRDRNRIFLTLLVVVGAAAALTLGDGGRPLLIWGVGKLVGTPEAQLDALRSGFPWGIAQSTLLIAIFYLMVNLHHRSASVLRSYRYLGELEREIRVMLGESTFPVAFSRESTYYWKQAGRFDAYVRWAYVTLLGLLLNSFELGRLWQDFVLWQSAGGSVRSVAFGVVAADVFIGGWTLLFYCAYVGAAFGVDTAPARASAAAA